ncbi:hypothetical protein [Hyalangium rubrum]|uniref:Uncharacterized protein n=1 Tax=Hyalangium rubrum TaxID=3103134 RepID=A0ABU5GV18_9BACT|nr:hypothetical protein [Hyalangium sp. s54d21]MDY7225018.1 hypothetical protein [Hyalangium sp. s54d21]
MLLLSLATLVVSALMVVALFVSLFVSQRSLTKPTFVVGVGDLLVAGFMMASGDESTRMTATLPGIAGVLVLFIALLIYVGESMLGSQKEKRTPPSKPPRRPSVRDFD